MRVALTGASGLVGRFVHAGLAAAGHEVVVLGRGGIPYRLGDVPEVEADVLVHAAFAHLPGRYRGGEGDDPDGFRRANLDGSVRLLRAFGGRSIFLSSRAVYGDHSAGTPLTEDLEPRPDTLYGEVKAAVEPEATVSLRATGVYGPGAGHKWEGLFRDFLEGRPVAPRAATEVHGEDVAAAVIAVLARGQGVFNVSDLLVDRRDLLAEVAVITGCANDLPDRADSDGVVPNVMDCARLSALGWQPGGWGRLVASLPPMLQSVPSR